MTKIDLYEFMKEELIDEGQSKKEIPSVETFLYVWRTEYKELVIPRYNTFGACDVCLSLKMQKRKFPSGSGEHRNVSKTMNAHLELVRREREEQVLRDQKAGHSPLLQWTITTDFMVDLALPWLATKPKGWFKKKHLSMKVFGYINAATQLRFVVILCLFRTLMFMLW